MRKEKQKKKNLCGVIKSFILKVIKTNLSMAVRVEARKNKEKEKMSFHKKINDAIEGLPRHNMCRIFHFCKERKFYNFTLFWE